MRFERVWIGILVLCCGLAMGEPVRAQIADAAMLRPIQLSLREVTAESGLLQLARAGEFDFLIDSTRIDAARKTSHEYKGRFGDDLIFFAQDHRLSAYRHNSHMMLFWAEPEVVDIGRAIAGGAGFQREAGTPANADFSDAFHQYLNQNADAAERMRTGIPLSDLPLELQKSVAATAVARILDEYDPPNHKDTWFQDGFWQKVRLYYELPEDGKIPDIPTPFEVKAVLETTRPKILLSRSLLPTNYKVRSLETRQYSQVLRRTPQGIETTRTWLLESLIPGQPRVRVSEKHGATPDAPRVRVVEVQHTPDAAWQKGEDPAEAARLLSKFGPLEDDKEELRGTTLQLLQNRARPLDVSAEKSLQVPVKLDVMRQPLRDVLADLEKQSGVRLLNDSKEIGDLLLTARLRPTPLHEVLSGLTRLYNIAWTKRAEAEYVVDVSGRTNFDTQLLQLGTMWYYRFRQHVRSGRQARDERLRELTDRVFNQFGEEDLAAPEGIAFKSLPPEIQKQIRDQIEYDTARDMAHNQLTARSIFSHDWTLRLIASQRQQPLLQGLINGKPRFMIPIEPPRKKLVPGPGLTR